MRDKIHKIQFENIIFKIYFWLLLVHYIVFVVNHKGGYTLVDWLCYFIMLISFVPFWGYAFGKRLLNYTFWKYYAIAYGLWIIAYHTFLHTNYLADNLMHLFVVTPKYWAVLLYPFEVMEQNITRRDVFLWKKADLFEKYQRTLKTLYHIFNIFILAMAVILMSSMFHESPSKGDFIVLMYFLFIASFYFFLSTIWLYSHLENPINGDHRRQCLHSYFAVNLFLLVLFDGSPA